MTHYIACDLGAESGRVMLGTLDAGKRSLLATEKAGGSSEAPLSFEDVLNSADLEKEGVVGSIADQLAEQLAGLKPLDGGDFHAYRRKWATERKHLPRRMLRPLAAGRICARCRTPTSRWTLRRCSRL